MNADAVHSPRTAASSSRPFGAGLDLTVASSSVVIGTVVFF